MAVKTIDGKTVTVDDSDRHWLDRIRWKIAPNGYVFATVYLHRLIADPPNGLEVDHVDGDKLNNHRHNLEHVTHGENLRRRGPVQRPSKNYRKHSDQLSSRFVGVCWHSQLKRWRATFRRKHLGTYSSEEEAANAYNQAAVEAYGKMAFLNKT